MHRPREVGDEPAASRSRAGCARASQTAARARRPPFAAAPSGPCNSAPRPRPHSSSWLRRQDQQAAQTGPADWAVGERRAGAGAHPPDLCKALGHLPVQRPIYLVLLPPAARTISWRLLRRVMGPLGSALSLSLLIHACDCQSRRQALACTHRVSMHLRPRRVT